MKPTDNPDNCLQGDLEYHPVTFLSKEEGRRDPVNVFEVRIGDTLIGGIYKHRCEEWVFVTYDHPRPLRAETMLKIAQVIEWASNFDWNKPQDENAPVAGWKNWKDGCK